MKPNQAVTKPNDVPLEQGPSELLHEELKHNRQAIPFWWEGNYSGVAQLAAVA